MMADDPKHDAEQSANEFKDQNLNNSIYLDPSALSLTDTVLQGLSENPIYINYDSIARGAFGLDEATQQRYRELELELSELKVRMDDQAKTLKAEKLNSADRQRQLEQLKQTVAQLKDAEQLSFLLSRVNQDAKRVLLESREFRAKFATNRECNAFVMSVDIRRSTELTLKARTAEQFASFITTLCAKLIDSVLGCYGVLDKFTGDGILAFFPEFFSGPDAGYYVLLAADRCHKAFQGIYHEYRTAFNSILKDTGLGVGVDYGAARLVQMAGGLSVVGPPVVYACRMGGAPAGKTLLNQPAYEQISRRFSPNCFLHETEIEIKHEGATLAYEVSLSKQTIDPQRPNWCALTPAVEDSTPV
jgi:class 3 adenylate cyclase